MASKHDSDDKVERYARRLVELARAAGRANPDLVQWRHARKFSPEVLSVLGEMELENDSSLVERVAKRYEEFLAAQDQTVAVTVTTSVPMDDELRSQVRSKMEKELGAPVYLVERVDPDILGGIVLEARGKRYDASVRTQLSTVRKSLSATFYGGEA